MKTKKLILSIIAVLGVSAFSAINAHATTWYVRDGGGTPAQCTGTTNAVYSGSGANLPCAFNHPAWVIGTPQGGTGLMVGGDTLYIVGDSDVNPGQQAQYMIGYGMPNTVSAQCATTWAYACIMSTVPAGISSTQLTTIIGIGTHQPQLWGTEGINYILDLTAGNYDIENLEITQHSSCSDVIGSSNPGYNGYPGACGGTGGSYPFGPTVATATWAKIGIELEGTNITTKNLWIHRLGNDDIYFPGNVGNWNSTNDKITSGASFLDDGGTMTFSGNNTMTNDIWAFGGFAEKYPTPDPGNVKDLNNYLNGCDQNCGALGGGFMMQNDNTGSCGNWTISDSQFLFNLKTNIDFLHCNGTGTFNFYRSRSEGSTGEALKLNLATVNIESSQLIGNAPVWSTPAFKAILAPYSTYNVSWTPDICRGNAVAIFTGNPNGQVNFLNSDVTGNCTALVEISNEIDASTYACPGMSINAHNTKFIAGYGYDINEQMDVFYNGGNDGNGDGPCGTGTVPFNENYNSIYNVSDTSHCTGANSLCGTDPKVLFEATTPLASVLGPTAYYSGTSLGDQLYLQSSSPLKGAGTTDVTFTNGSSNDYNNIPQNSPPTIGAIQYSSCIAANNFCSISSECCGGTCSSEGQCVGTQPVVSITNPTSGSSSTAGDNLTVTTTASETNGTIRTISLYNGAGALLGSSSASPYNYVMTDSAAGTYTFYAVATDANGVSTTSSSVTVTVEEASILPSLPVVAITSSGGSTFTAGSNITLNATASETNGTISKISIYNGTGALLGSGSTSPYNYVYSDALAGTYTFYAVATDVNGVSTTSISITVAVTAPSSPVVAITSPVTGSTLLTGSNITITATASETNGSIAKVSFYYNGTYLLGSSTTSPYSYTVSDAPTGSYSLTAVATDANGVSVTSSAVAVTVSATAKVAPVVTIIVPGSGSNFTAGSNIAITATASEAGGTISKVMFYNGSTLLGTDTTSPYSYTWSSVAAGSYSLTAVAYDSDNNTTTSTAVAVTVSGLPVVSLSTNNTSFTAPASVVLTATASETSGTISKVMFYNGSTLLGTDTTSPYSYTWSSVAAGSYSLTAVATDANGVSTTSSTVAVTVAAAAKVSPVVAITSPATGASFTSGSNVTITATASETGGTISKVMFYNGSTLLGTDTTSPYSYTWSSVAAGSYSLTAVAYDSDNNTTTSTAVAVTVSGLPVVSLSTNNTSFTAPASVVLTATASETSGTISKVMFYNGSTLLGTDTTSPYSYTWSSVAAGSYSLTAVAYDNNSHTTTSTAVAITVTGSPVVSLSTNNTSFTAPASVVLTATASESNGTISKVAFYNGSTLLGTDTTSPYSYTWSSVAAGSYNLTAVATDAKGVSTTSSTVAVTVAAAASAPVVAIIVPTNGTVFTVGSSITITATASETNGSIAKVSFYYNGTVLLGSSTTSPYTYTANGVGIGSYPLTAVATDARGVSVTSSSVTISVIAAPIVPVVAITSPASGSSVAAGSSITITATASETGGSISQVAFYNGSTLLGTATSSPYSYTWSNVAAGSYSLTAVATDAKGVSTTSSAVTGTVTAKVIFKF